MRLSQRIVESTGPSDKLGSLLIQPIGFRVQDDKIRVDLLIEGPVDSTLAAAEIIASHVVGDPAIWLEVENFAREPLHLTPFFGQNARINIRATDHARTVVLEAKPVMRTVVTVVAKTSEELDEDTRFYFRLSPNAPYQRRLDAIGTAPGIHQVVTDTAWYRTLSPWK